MIGEHFGEIFDIGFTHTVSNIQNKMKSILMTTETSLVPPFQSSPLPTPHRKPLYEFL